MSETTSKKARHCSSNQSSSCSPVTGCGLVIGLRCHRRATQPLKYSLGLSRHATRLLRSFERVRGCSARGRPSAPHFGAPISITQQSEVPVKPVKPRCPKYNLAGLGESAGRGSWPTRLATCRATYAAIGLHSCRKGRAPPSETFLKRGESSPAGLSTPPTGGGYLTKPELSTELRTLRATSSTRRRA